MKDNKIQSKNEVLQHLISKVIFGYQTKTK